jgi:enoyl-CoA hydratase/carnithine racemase
VVNAPIAVWESRKVALSALTADDDTLWQMTADGFRRVGRTEDFAEGPRAFIEKRAPMWKGR